MIGACNQPSPEAGKYVSTTENGVVWLASEGGELGACLRSFMRGGTSRKVCVCVSDCARPCEGNCQGTKGARIRSRAEWTANWSKTVKTVRGMSYRVGRRGTGRTNWQRASLRLKRLACLPCLPARGVQSGKARASCWECGEPGEQIEGAWTTQASHVMSR